MHKMAREAGRHGCFCRGPQSESVSVVELIDSASDVSLVPAEPLIGPSVPRKQVIDFLCLLCGRIVDKWARDAQRFGCTCRRVHAPRLDYPTTTFVAGAADFFLVPAQPLDPSTVAQNQKEVLESLKIDGGAQLLKNHKDLV